MFKRVWPLLAILFVAGCATVDTASMASLDYTFDASRTRTKEAIIATFIPRNYQIVRDSEFQLVMDRPANDNFAAQLVFGSRFNTVPNARVMLTFLGDRPTKVNARLFVVTNPGSGFENSTDISNNADARASVARAMAQARALLGSS